MIAREAQCCRLEHILCLQSFRRGRRVLARGEGRERRRRRRVFFALVDGERRGYSLPVTDEPQLDSPSLSDGGKTCFQTQERVISRSRSRPLPLSLLPFSSSASAKKRRAADNRITSAKGRRLVKKHAFHQALSTPPHAECLSSETASFNSPLIELVPLCCFENGDTKSSTTTRHKATLSLKHLITAVKDGQRRKPM